MRALRRTIVCVFLLAAVGCSQKGLDTRMKFNSRVGAGADLTQTGTWNWVPKQTLPTGDPRIDDPSLLQYLEDRISAELDARKLPQDMSKPDFLVSYEIGITTQLDDPAWINTYSHEQFSNNPTDWEQGNLMIMFFSTKTGQALWAGWAQGELDERASKQQGRDNLRKIVEKIFQRFDADRGNVDPEAKSFDQGQ